MQWRNAFALIQLVVIPITKPFLTSNNELIYSVSSCIVAFELRHLSIQYRQSVRKIKLVTGLTALPNVFTGMFERSRGNLMTYLILILGQHQQDLPSHRAQQWEEASWQMEEVVESPLSRSMNLHQCWWIPLPCLTAVVSAIMEAALLIVPVLSPLPSPANGVVVEEVVVDEEWWMTWWEMTIPWDQHKQTTITWHDRRRKSNINTQCHFISLYLVYLTWLSSSNVVKVVHLSMMMTLCHHCVLGLLKGLI